MKTRTWPQAWRRIQRQLYLARMRQDHWRYKLYKMARLAGGGRRLGKQLDALLEKQHHKCALTGRKLTPSNVSLDHIWPLSRGGSSEITNCQLVVREANSAKGALTPAEFIELCRQCVSENRRQKRRDTQSRKRARTKSARKKRIRNRDAYS